MYLPAYEISIVEHFVCSLHIHKEINTLNILKLSAKTQWQHTTDMIKRELSWKY